MSSESQESTQSVEQNRSTASDNTPPVEDTFDAEPLTITLPDGCESVSDAIVAHREMLTAPQDHGLATDEEITHLSEAMETLSDDVERVTQQCDETDSQITELQDLVERQQQQITELQSVVTSFAEILGTEADWDTFPEA